MTGGGAAPAFTTTADAERHPATRTGRAVKRALDLTVSLTALAVLSPLLLLIAALVRAEDGGPALFRQVRAGRRLAPFEILKFRTMRAAPGPLLTRAGDARITRVGRVLRRFRLDELPQLWNVVRGDMSLVGPRPEVFAFALLYAEDRRPTLDLRPGITGPAQLAGLGEEDELAAAADPERHYVEVLLPRKLAWNRLYAERRSFGTDLRILARTAASTLRAGFAPPRPRALVQAPPVSEPAPGLGAASSGAALRA